MNTNFNLIMQIIILGSVGLLCIGPVWTFSKKILRFFFISHKYATEFVVLFSGFIVCLWILCQLIWQKIPMVFPNMRTILALGAVFFIYVFFRLMLNHLREMDKVVPPYDENY